MRVINREKGIDKMGAKQILSEFIQGKHTLGQMLNLVKYSVGKKEITVNWDPIIISTFITYKCNFNCDMCLTHSKKFSNPFGQKPTRDMDFELFKQILNRYKNALTVNLIGNGEPLLHKDFFRMIEYASTVMKMNVCSSSNGILVEKYIEEILTSPLKHLNISINGHNSQEFNRMTGMPPELFINICEGIAELTRQKKAKCSKLRIAATIILDQQNYRSLKDMVCFAQNLGVDEVAFFNFLPVPKEGFTAKERCLFSDDQEVLETFAKVSTRYSRTGIEVMLPPLLDRQMNNNKFCSTPFYNLSIDGNGNIGGCSCQLLNLSENGRFDERMLGTIHI